MLLMLLLLDTAAGGLLAAVATAEGLLGGPEPMAQAGLAAGSACHCRCASGDVVRSTVPGPSLAKVKLASWAEGRRRGRCRGVVGAAPSDWSGGRDEALLGSKSRPET